MGDRLGISFNTVKNPLEKREGCSSVATLLICVLGLGDINYHVPILAVVYFKHLEGNGPLIK